MNFKEKAKLYAKTFNPFKEEKNFFKRMVKTRLEEERMENYQRSFAVIQGLDIPYHTPKAMKTLRNDAQEARKQAETYADIMLGNIDKDGTFDVRTNKNKRQQLVDSYLKIVEEGGTLPKNFFKKVSKLHEKVGASDNTARTKRVVDSIKRRAGRK